MERFGVSGRVGGAPWFEGSLDGGGWGHFGLGVELELGESLVLRVWGGTVGGCTLVGLGGGVCGGSGCRLDGVRDWG